MQHLQRYFLTQLLWPLMLACVALSVLAVLTQSLSVISLIINQGETLLLFLWVVALTMPQLMALVLPVALFIAILHGLHRMHSDSELVVAATSGLSRWEMISPIMRLTAVIMAVQLAIGLWLQPIAHREMRHTLHEARVQMATSLVQPGEFSRPAHDLTIFVRAIDPDGAIHDVYIEDRRAAERPVVYLAKRGRIVESATTPAILLRDGNIQIVEPDGRRAFLDFDSAPFDLAQFIEPPGQLFYKLSDRFPHELFYPNSSHYWERANTGAMIAEGHSRLAAPFYNLALAAIAIYALLGGDYRRSGYGRRIAIAALAALALRLGGFAVQAGAAAAPALNGLQYALPLGAAFVALLFYFTSPVNARPRAPLRGAPAAA